MKFRYIVYINDDEYIGVFDNEYEAQNKCIENKDYWYLGAYFHEKKI